MSRDPTGLTEAFAAVLARRYSWSTALDPALTTRWTARRVHVNGKPCVAKLIAYPRNASRDERARRDARFETELRAYAALPRGPVRLVDSFRDDDLGCVVVTSEFVGAAPWDTYMPTDAHDGAVARGVLKQLARVHALGLAHGGLALDHVLFRPPSDVALISLAFATPATRAECHAEYRFLLHALLSHPRTRGVAFHVLDMLGPANAKRALVTAAGWLADAADKWKAAERARLEATEGHPSTTGTAPRASSASSHRTRGAR